MDTFLCVYVSADSYALGDRFSTGSTYDTDF